MFTVLSSQDKIIKNLFNIFFFRYINLKLLSIWHIGFRIMSLTKQFYLKYQDRVPNTDHIHTSQYYTTHLFISKYLYPQKVTCSPKCKTQGVHVPLKGSMSGNADLCWESTVAGHRCRVSTMSSHIYLGSMAATTECPGSTVIANVSYMGSTVTAQVYQGT